MAGQTSSKIRRIVENEIMWSCVARVVVTDRSRQVLGVAM